MSESILAADPLGCVARLRRVRTSPLWAQAAGGDEAAARLAAAEMAVALGRCRLFGVEPPADLDGTLPMQMTLDAIAEWTLQLTTATREANELPAQWDDCDEPLEADHLCLNLLQRRTDAWAAWLAIDEGYEDALCENQMAALTQLEKPIEGFLDALDAFDTALQQYAELLATVADLPALGNWRENLAERYAVRLPWWLDGRLELILKRLRGSNPISPAGNEPTLDLSSMGSPLVLAAKDKETRGGPVSHKWREPLPGNHAARLTLPTRIMSTDDKLVLTLYGADGNRAADLNGQIVRLVGVDGKLEGGRATFTAEQFGPRTKTRRKLTLEVALSGGPFVAWLPEEDKT